MSNLNSSYPQYGGYGQITTWPQRQSSRTVKETVREYDSEGRLVKETVTETIYNEYPQYQAIWNS